MAEQGGETVLMDTTEGAPIITFTAVKVTYEQPNNVRGTCGIYKVGDKMVFRGHELLLDRTDKACGHVIAANQFIVTTIAKGGQMALMKRVDKPLVPCFAGCLFEISVEYPEGDPRRSRKGGKTS